MIRILDKDVTDKIAAGEVIERPLSAVKELVENSIDALPDSITVEIKKGGKSYIRVTDNGTGISADEVECAFKRHATSKLVTASDLNSIETLGFRGEALPSIAAVSHVDVITKTRDQEAGRHLTLEGGKFLENSVIGAENGTTVVVRNLFYNTPARQKFLKSDSAEASAIIGYVSQMALAYTNIKFRLINNGNALFRTMGTCDRKANILTIYGRNVGDELIDFRAGCEFMEVEGYVSNPGWSMSTRKNQIFFVNGRTISSKVIEKAVSEAYSDRLFSGRHPAAYIFVVIDPMKIDVNVHPNKKEIKFLDAKAVESFLAEKIRNALKRKDAIPEVRTRDIAKPEKSEAAVKAPEQTSASDQLDMKSVLSAIRKEQDNMILRESMAVQDNMSIKAGEKHAREYNTDPEIREFDINDIEVTGTVFSTYITAKDGDSFYFIDQHAAHERVFFEKLMREYRNSEKHVQNIMIPVTVNVPYEVSENEADWMNSLISMGYDISEFGPRTYRINGIPAFMELSEGEKFMNDFIENCNENTDLDSIDTVEKIIMRSCKSAIKANDIISEDEINALLKDLADCSNPFSCPHGRPTLIKLTKHEIEKLFKRI